MKLWITIQLAGFAFISAVCGISIRGIYLYWDHEATTDATRSMTIETSCVGDTVLDCTFIETPVQVQRFSEVLFPTLLCACIVTAVGIAALIALLRSRTLRAVIHGE